MVVRFSRSQYSPALFDIGQDIVGSLPIKLVERWLHSEQTHEDACRLLAPMRVVGFNVASDSAGLTRLTLQRGLLEILALIDRPKEIIHAIGTGIGGEAIGIWAADNTQMFYPQDIAAAPLLSALLAVQDAVTRRCQIQIGIGVHFGEFYRVSGGLYGAESDAIEAIAEHDTVGGEIVVTRAIVERLPADHGFTLAPREDLRTPIGPIWRVLDGPRLTAPAGARGHYPIPYSAEFHADLLAFERHLDDPGFAQAMTAKYTQHRTVVLVEREGEATGTHEVGLFVGLALSAMLKDAGLRHLDEHGREIKVVGPLGIYTFTEPARALAFAETFRRELAREGIRVRVGIDTGPVLVFDLASGGKDIAGAPVNIASKMAQDRGEWGRIYLSERLQGLARERGFTPMHYVVSGVELRVFAG
jgi:class 3 adenylate cyclase